MKCFNGNDSYSIFEGLKHKLKESIRKLSADELDKTNRDEWLDYWIGQYEVELVTIYPETAEIDVSEKTVQTYSTWYQMDRTEPKCFDVAGVKATCRVAYSGTYWFFEMRPSTFSLIGHDAEDVSKPCRDGVGYITFVAEIPLGSASPEGIQEHFTEKIEDFAKQISYCNSDAEQYNASLPSIVESELDRRIEQVDKFATIRKGLNLPLVRTKDSSHPIPVPMKKKRIKISKPDKQQGEEQSYSIEDSVFSHINEVIENTGAMMERTPSAYSSLNEEQLRDILLTTLNSHYENIATGETFRKHGKADIHIPVEKHAAYIAECKIWHGEKAFRKAVDQLFSYTTWRDTKVSIVIFNKQNKNFESILNNVDLTLREMAVTMHRPDHSQWTCKIQNEDDERIMHVTVQLFDLSL